MNIIIYIPILFIILNVVLSTYIPKKTDEMDIIDNNQNIISTKNYKNDVDTIIINEDKFIEKTNIPYEDKKINILVIIVGGLIGAFVGFFGGSLILFIILIILGFTTGGIAPVSFAAWWMSLYGGYIPAGGIYAMFQSMGALGFTSFFGGFIPILNSLIGFLIAECIIYFLY